MDKREEERQEKRHITLFNQAVFRVLFYAKAYQSATSRRTKTRYKKAGLRSLESALSLL